MPRKKTLKKELPKEVAPKVVVAGIPAGESVEETIKQRVTKLVTEPKVAGMVGFPTIRGGVCEFCGVKAEECPHYKDAIVHCSYCGEKTDRRMNVASLSSDPNTLIVFCANYACEKAHAERFLGRKI
jgi:hypothetical protein